jgi:hypothetical protein
MAIEKQGWGVEEVFESARALFLSALCAIPLGVVTGICAGCCLGLCLVAFTWMGLLVPFGACAGAVVGVPIGFQSALLGGAIGGKKGWIWICALLGACGGLALTEVYNHRGYLNGLLPFTTTLPAIGGAITGSIIGAHLENPKIRRNWFLRIISRPLNHSPLCRLPVGLRLVIALVEAVPVTASLTLLVLHILRASSANGGFLRWPF